MSLPAFSAPSRARRHVLVGRARVRQRLVDAVGQPSRDPEGARALHGAHLDRDLLLHGPREGVEPVVREEVAVVRDGAVLQERAHDVDRLDQARHRLAVGPVVDAVLVQQPEVARGDDDLRPAVGELVERGHDLADVGRLPQEDVRDVRAEADALGLVWRPRRTRRTGPSTTSRRPSTRRRSRARPPP